MSDVLSIPASGLITPDGQPLSTKLWGFDEEKELKEIIFRDVGDLEDITIYFNRVLVWKYIRTKVSENLVASSDTNRADRYEGVIGLLLKRGPAAFVDDPKTNLNFWGADPQPGTWVMYYSSDGWDKNIQIIGEPRYAECRILQDAHIVGEVKFPGRIL